MYIEGLRTATLINGVLRIEMLYRNAAGEDVTAGEVLLPGVRLRALIESLQEVETKIHETAQAEGVAGNA